MNQKLDRCGDGNWIQELVLGQDLMEKAILTLRFSAWKCLLNGTACVRACVCVCALRKDKFGRSGYTMGKAVEEIVVQDTEGIRRGAKSLYLVF